MSEPLWFDSAFLLRLYEDVVAASGGAAGVRDQGPLESALARPIQRLAYEGVTDLMDLAATYAVAISSNHPFIDCNKRMAFMALGQFLNDNGLDLTASDEEATATMLGVARGEIGIEDLVTWLRSRTAPATD